VGVQDVNPLAADDFGQSARAGPVHAGPPIQDLDRKALAAQFLTQAPQIVEANEQEPMAVTELPREPRGQNLSAAHDEVVHYMADGGGPDWRWRIDVATGYRHHRASRATCWSNLPHSDFSETVHWVHQCVP
jgi:hypothetical protein